MTSLIDNFFSSLEANWNNYAEHQRYIAGYFLQNCQSLSPFVFSRNSIEASIKDFIVTDEFVAPGRIDLPFMFCSFECEDGKIIFSINPEKDFAECIFLAVYEVSPGFYICGTLEKKTDGLIYTGLWTENVFKPEINGTISVILNKLLSKIALGSGQINQKTRFRVGSGKDRKLVKINRFIYVGSKKESERNKASLGFEVDWSHRFEVRGHWRKLIGMGKDRDGKYSIEGFTWVSEHVRGPDHLPLIKKVRIVENQENGG